MAATVAPGLRNSAFNQIFGSGGMFSVGEGLNILRILYNCYQPNLAGSSFTKSAAVPALT